MKSFHDILLSQPEEPLTIADNEEAKRFLVEFGLSANIKANITESRAQIISHTTHLTHYFAVLYFSGKTVESDNGYFICCLPKAKFSRADFEAYLVEMTTGHNDVEDVREIKDGSGAN